ncbi:unnamed protein product, partial (mitochondrion) [Musa textilis]
MLLACTVNHRGRAGLHHRLWHRPARYTIVLLLKSISRGNRNGWRERQRQEGAHSSIDLPVKERE